MRVFKEGRGPVADSVSDAYLARWLNRMHRMWTLQQAEKRFSAVVDAAVAGQPQHVTRRGRPAVVVLSTAEYERLLIAARADRGRFAEHLLAFPGAELERATAAPRDVRF